MHTINRWGKSRDVWVCPQGRGWDYFIYFLPLADVMHVNTLAVKVGWINWIQGDWSKINKMKQHNLEFVGNM